MCSTTFEHTRARNGLRAQLLPWPRDKKKNTKEMDDSTFSNPYLTELRVMIRENAAVSEMYARMLQAFVLDYNQRLENKMQGVETASEEAQKFLEAYERLVADFENFTGQISFADPIELKAMYENRSYWEQRMSSLPAIPARKQLQPLPLEEPTPETPAAPSVAPVAPKGTSKSTSTSKTAETGRSRVAQETRSRPVGQAKRMPAPGNPGYGVHGRLAAVAA